MVNKHTETSMCLTIVATDYITLGALPLYSICMYSVKCLSWLLYWYSVNFTILMNLYLRAKGLVHATKWWYRFYFSVYCSLRYLLYSVCCPVWSHTVSYSVTLLVGLLVCGRVLSSLVIYESVFVFTDIFLYWDWHFLRISLRPVSQWYIETKTVEGRKLSYSFLVHLMFMWNWSQ